VGRFLNRSQLARTSLPLFSGFERLSCKVMNKVSATSHAVLWVAAIDSTFCTYPAAPVAVERKVHEYRQHKSEDLLVA
jgi:hypothetical protein